MSALYEIDNGKLKLNFHTGQWRAWKSKRRFVAVLAGTQGGKAAAIDTPIPTPGGFVPIGDVKVGDVVFDDRGRPCNVTAVSPVYLGNECFRVTFDDGVSVVVDGDHLWETQTFKQRKNARRRVVGGTPGWAAKRWQCRPTPDQSVVTTRHIAATVMHSAKHRNHSIKLCEPVQFPPADLPIPPYTLGVWLGDGYSSASCFVTADPEILKWIHADGYRTGKPRLSNSGRARTYTIGSDKGRGGAGRDNPFMKALRECDLLRNKHIPAAYLTASVEQRLALLQGLMDTDGHIGKKCEFSASNKSLADGVLRLAQSLGIKARMSSRQPRCNGKVCRTSYRVSFSTTLPVFRLPRKLARVKESIRDDARNRYIASVEPVPSVPVRCIAVDSPSHLYLCTEAFVPTHNTSYGPWWLWREIQSRGPGDYLAVTSTYDLFKLKMLPMLRDTFEHVLRCGRYWSGDRIMELADPATGKFLAGRADDPMWGRIILRSAESDSGLEASTAKAAWLDEAGQPEFTVETWEAILRRLSLNLGRVLLTTTVYSLGWLKVQVYDRWKAGDPNFEVVQFDSTENPNFPREEADRARLSMPLWRYNMQYRGMFSRPAGLVYDCFDEGTHLVPRFALDPKWTRYAGLDFGAVNTAAVLFAEEPRTRRLFAYREYHPGQQRTAREHALAIMAGEPMVPTCIGGAKSEDRWRDEFCQAGLPVQPPPVHEVEVGINRVYGALQRRELFVFNDLTRLVDQFQSYARKVDDQGQPMEEIDKKSEAHVLDAVRYAVSALRQYAGPVTIGMPTRRDGARQHGNVLDDLPGDVFG